MNAVGWLVGLNLQHRKAKTLNYELKSVQMEGRVRSENIFITLDSSNEMANIYFLKLNISKELNNNHDVLLMYNEVL